MLLGTIEVAHLVTDAQAIPTVELAAQAESKKDGQRRDGLMEPVKLE
jgi:hypothetical protein